MKDCKESLVKVQGKGKELVSLSSDLTDILENSVPRYRAAKEDLKDKQEKYSLAQVRYCEIEEKRRHCEKVLANCRAGILAS